MDNSINGRIDRQLAKQADGTERIQEQLNLMYEMAFGEGDYIGTMDTTTND